MIDESLLLDLGATESSDQEVPEELQRLVAGEITATERAELVEAAKTDPRAATLLARFSPLGPEDDDRIATAMAATVKAERRGPFSGVWVGMGVGMGVAAAAAATVVVSNLEHELPMPDYMLESATPDLVHRGDPSSNESVLPIHGRESALSLVLRPSTPVAEPIAVATFLVYPSRVEALEMAWQVSQRGAARLDGRVADLMPNLSGQLTLLAVVHPAASAAPTADEVWAYRESGSSPPHLRGVEYRFRVPD